MKERRNEGRKTHAEFYSWPRTRSKRIGSFSANCECGKDYLANVREFRTVVKETRIGLLEDEQKKCRMNHRSFPGDLRSSLIRKISRIVRSSRETFSLVWRNKQETLCPNLLDQNEEIRLRQRRRRWLP